MLEIIDDCKVDSKKSLASKISANFEHYIWVHDFGLVRTIGFLLLAVGSIFWFPFPHGGRGISVLLINLGVIFGAVFITLVPCRCGKIFQVNRERQKRVNASQLRHPGCWEAFSVLLAIFGIVVVVFCPSPSSLGLSRQCLDFICLVLNLFIVIISTVFGLAFIFGLNSKLAYQHMQLPKMLMNQDFGPDSLIGRTDEELNFLISLAMKQGDFEQADMMSRHLLHKAESLDLSQS